MPPDSDSTGQQDRINNSAAQGDRDTIDARLAGVDAATARELGWTEAATDECDRCHADGGVKYLPLDNPTEYVCVECMTPDERTATGWA